MLKIYLSIAFNNESVDSYLQIHYYTHMDLYTQIKEAAQDVMTRSVDMCNDPQLNRTLAFADKAHQRGNPAHDGMHFRKYLTHLPYIVHPVRVSNIVRIAGGTIAQQRAALLHDTVEDTPITMLNIYLNFDNAVADMVNGLTDVSPLPVEGGPNRNARKTMDREHSIAQPGETQTVKYADLIDNTFDIVYHDPSFAKTYLEEKALLLDGMDKGCPALREVAYRMLDEGMLIAMTKR